MKSTEDIKRIPEIAIEYDIASTYKDKFNAVNKMFFSEFKALYFWRLK